MIGGEVVNSGGYGCIFYPELSCSGEKEQTNDLSIKNSRLWAKEQIRLNHDKMMVARKSKDNEKETVNYNKQLNLLMTYIGHGMTVDITELGGKAFSDCQEKLYKGISNLINRKYNIKEC